MVDYRKLFDLDWQDGRRARRSVRASASHRRALANLARGSCALTANAIGSKRRRSHSRSRYVGQAITTMPRGQSDVTALRGGGKG